MRGKMNLFPIDQRYLVARMGTNTASVLCPVSSSFSLAIFLSQSTKKRKAKLHSQNKYTAIQHTNYQYPNLT